VYTYYVRLTLADSVVLEEYSLHHASQEGQVSIFERYDTTIAPALTHVISSKQDQDYQPLLQAATLVDAPKTLILISLITFIVF
jgi:hypothetical protein